MNDLPKQLQFVPTATLLGYLATILAWEAEVASVLLHVFGHQQMAIAHHAVVLSAGGALSFFAWWRRSDFLALRSTRGQIPITTLQGFIITVFLLTAVCLAVWIGMQIFA